MLPIEKIIAEFSVKHHAKFQKLCAPIFDKLPINYMFYVEITKNGEMRMVGTHPEIIFQYFNQKLFKINPFYSENVISGIYPHLSVKTPGYERILQTLKEFKSFPFAMILEREKDKIIHYGYTLKADDPNMRMLMMNEIPLLKRFGQFFRQEIKPILKKMAENPFNVAQARGQSFFEKSTLPKAQLDSLEKLELFKGLGVIDSTVGKLSLSPREIELIKHRIDYKSNQEIAEALNLSVRTVESYLDNAKTKLNCSNRDEFNDLLETLKIIYPGDFE